jgi:hypothetical protein
MGRLKSRTAAISRRIPRLKEPIKASRWIEKLVSSQSVAKALALAMEPARTNGPVALPIFHEDPARLRRERTTHRLFYSSNFLTKRDEMRGVAYLTFRFIADSLPRLLSISY